MRNRLNLALNLRVDGDECHEEAEGDEAQECPQRRPVAQVQLRRKHPQSVAAKRHEMVNFPWNFKFIFRESCLFMIGQWSCVDLELF